MSATTKGKVKRSIGLDDFVWSYIEQVAKQEGMPNLTKALEYIILEHKIIRNNGIAVSLNGVTHFQGELEEELIEEAWEKGMDEMLDESVSVNLDDFDEFD